MHGNRKEGTDWRAARFKNPVDEESVDDYKGEDKRRMQRRPAKVRLVPHEREAWKETKITSSITRSVVKQERVMGPRSNFDVERS